MLALSKFLETVVDNKCVITTVVDCVQIYCCVGLLAITGRLHHVNVDQLGWWLCERQLPSGGLNGMVTYKLYFVLVVAKSFGLVSRNLDC